MPSKSDTIPAMLTPGEVVLNEKQQKALEKYVGQSREEIFGKIKVPGFNIGGKVKKYYAEGGQAKDKELSQREKNIKGWQDRKKKYNKGGMVKKAYSRMYKAKWGG
jgi:hypothetical protein